MEGGDIDMKLAKSKRLEMRSNIRVDRELLIYPVTAKKEIDILSIKPIEDEDGSFVFYGNADKKVCQIGISDNTGVDDMHPFEIKCETEETYRHQGYMVEALQLWLKWIFENTDVTTVWAYVIKNSHSEKILKKLQFQVDKEGDHSKKWYFFNKTM